MKTVSKIYGRLMMALLPFLFLPLIVDSFGLGKLWIFSVLMVLGLLLWIIGGVVKKESLKIYWSPVMVAFLLWTIWTVVSFVYMPLGLKMRTLMSVTGLVTSIVIMGMLFLWTQNSDSEEKDKQLGWVTVSGLLVAIVSLVVFLIPAAKFPILWPKSDPMLIVDANWSLLGGIMSEMFFLLVLAGMWIEKLVVKMKNGQSQNDISYIGEALVLSLLVLVVFLDGFRLFKGGFGYLDWRSSWIIAVESLKQNPIFGVGMGNFVEGFYWWRGALYNQNQNWSGIYSISGNWFTQIWTETGLVGLVLILAVVWQTIRVQADKFKKFIMLLVGVMVLALPFNWIIVLLWLWFSQNFGSVKRQSGEISLKMGESGINVGPALVLVLLIIGSVWGGNYWIKYMLGEVYYRKSLVFASKNDGSGTYNWQIKAIAMNESNPEYRRVYSQTNLALALSLLQNKDITEDDKQKAVTLVQQSVREAKATVALDNLNPGYWLNLAMIYKQLVGVIDGAADWSVQAYTQAGILDTVNPTLRLDFGGLLYALGSYDQADRIFEQAVTLKSNLANSWYNWAYTAKQMNKLADAVSRMTQAVALVPAGSGDYDKANKELETWKKELDAALVKQKEAAASAKVPAAKPETLTNPQALPTTVNKEVAVPTGGMEPPKVEITPTATVTPKL